MTQDELDEVTHSAGEMMDAVKKHVGIVRSFAACAELSSRAPRLGYDIGLLVEARDALQGVKGMTINSVSFGQLEVIAKCIHTLAKLDAVLKEVYVV